MNSIAVIAAALLSAGCISTIADVRNGTPSRTTTVRGDHVALAACAAEGFRTHESFKSVIWRVDARPGKRQSVWALTNSAHQVPVVDFTFSQVGDGVVRVESRWTFEATERRFNDRAWNVVAVCADQPIATSSQ